jgi:hypothetical protein
MSAIKLNEAIDLIRENDCSCVKILGLDKKRICEYIEDDGTSEGAIAYIERKKNMLSSYGRVQIIATTSSGKSQNWTNAFCWIVQCDNNLPVQQNSPDHVNAPRGFISASEAAIMAQFEALKLELKYNEQLRDLKEQLKAKEDSDPFSKYLPLLPVFVKDKETRQSIMGIALAMSGKSMQPAAGIAGGQGSTIQTEMSKEESQKRGVIFIEKINKLIAHEKVGIDKLEKFVDAVIEDPSIIDKLISLYETFK